MIFICLNSRHLWERKIWHRGNDSFNSYCKILVKHVTFMRSFIPWLPSKLATPKPHDYSSHLSDHINPVKYLIFLIILEIPWTEVNITSITLSLALWRNVLDLSIQTFILHFVYFTNTMLFVFVNLTKQNKIFKLSALTFVMFRGCLIVCLGEHINVKIYQTTISTLNKYVVQINNNKNIFLFILNIRGKSETERRVNNFMYLCIYQYRFCLFYYFDI